MDVLSCARGVLRKESEALFLLSANLDISFVEAVHVILDCRGKVILTGLGKSGYIAQKIASTFSSTGTPSLFLHSSEALHGDFGMIGPHDCLLAVAYGGETREVLAVAKFVKQRKQAVISITGYVNSSLGNLSDIKLGIGPYSEADHLKVAPTTSSTATLALGDALAVCLMKKRKFTLENFAALHPGGRLGRALSKVADIMRPISKDLFVGETDNFGQIIKNISAINFGILAVVNSSLELVGSITDGDLRRGLLQFQEGVFKQQAFQIMTKHPKTIDEKSSVLDAVSLMEKYKITSLFVLSQDNEGEIRGLVRLHDLITAHVV
tara:strand:+ start:20 stop:988 length:969 start_codon:yes stop_codon:yes gene_type:complete